MSPLRRPTRIETRTIATRWAVNCAGLRSYQVAGARWLAARARALLADEMRLGKTAQVLRALPPNARAIVVCPDIARPVWREQSRGWRPDLHVMQGLTRPPLGHLAIVSWDSLDEAIDGWASRLTAHALHDVVVVFDEAHYAKNPETLRHRRAKLLIRQAWRAWLLTATPLHDSIDDLAALLELVGIDRDGMLRRLARDVGVELPPRIYETINVDPAPVAVPDRLPRFEELAEERRTIASARADAAAGLARRFALEGRAVVVASEHVDPLRHVVRVTPRAGLITGTVVGEDRSRVVEAFRRGALEVLCLTADTAGTGIDLARASTLVEIDLPWSWGDLTQLEARLDAVGKREPVRIYRLTSPHPIDVRVAELLEQKERVVRAEVGVSDRAA